MSSLGATAIETVGEKFIDGSRMMFNQDFKFTGNDRTPPNIPDPTLGYGQILRMTDDGEIDLLLLCSLSCGSKIAGRVFQCKTEETDQEMVRDAIGEMLNVLAGQLKTGIASVHTIGLPVPYQTDAQSWATEKYTWNGRYLTDLKNDVNLWLAVREKPKGEKTL